MMMSVSRIVIVVTRGPTVNRPRRRLLGTTTNASIDPRRYPSSSSSSPSSSLSSSSMDERDDRPSSPGMAGISARALRRRIDENGRMKLDGRHNKTTSMSTRLSHAGLPSPSGFGDNDNDIDDNTSLCPSIELATTYERPPDGDYGSGGRVYARSCNPTRKLLEDTMGKLEMMFPRAMIGDDAKTTTTMTTNETTNDVIAPTFAFSSGMAAVASLLLSCDSPTRVLLPNDVYHGVPTQLITSLVDRNVSYESTDMTNIDVVRRTMERNLTSLMDDDDGGRGRGMGMGGVGTLIVWMETPSNPLCRVTDIRAVCDVVDEIRDGMIGGRMLDGDEGCVDEDDDDHCARRVIRLLTVVDSTWAPPCITLPLGHGADVVLHSGTKYLAGHSDALIGIVSCSPLTTDGKRASERLRSVQTSVGAVASPLESWLTLRGLRTLHLRLERQCTTAMRIATYLNEHPGVTACHYPGLSSHPQHDVARRQMGGSYFGGMLSFEVESEMMAMAVAGGVRVIRRATSLGGTETLIEHRASIEPVERRTSPVGLLRLSVGLEDADDLIRDLEVALEVATRVVKSSDFCADDGYV